MSSPFTSLVRVTPKSLFLMRAGSNIGLYMLLEYLILAASKRGNCCSSLETKSLQFLFDFALQYTSERAIALGHVIYSACLKVGTDSIHKFPCPPKIYFSSTLSGTGS